MRCSAIVGRFVQRVFAGRTVIVASTLALTSASSGCSTDCTLIGCFSGLFVVLSAPPSTPYRIEVYAGGSPARYVWACPTGGDCGGRALFPDFRPESGIAEVITGTDTTRFVLAAPIRYTENFPNGRDCGGACYSATVTLPPARAR